MKKEKLLWGIIFVLILLLGSTVAYFLSEKQESLPSHTPSILPATVKQDGQDGEDAPYTRYAAQFKGGGITWEELLNKLLDTYGEQVLEELIDRHLVFKKAEQLGVQLAEEEIEREVLSLRIGNTSEEEFYSEIEASLGISPDELKAEMEYYLLLEELATMDIVISEDEIREFYTEHPEMFEIPSQYHIYQIIVHSEQEATQVIDEIAQGSSFEAAAAEHSIDSLTASKGGDLGFVTSNDYFIEEELLATAGKLDLNTLSDPIPLEEGFAVIKVTEKVDGQKQELEEVEGKIRRQLALQQIGGTARFLERLREQAEIEIFLK